MLQHLPQSPLYARVDGLIAPDGRFMENEVELIEPALYPQFQPRLIEALRAELKIKSAYE